MKISESANNIYKLKNGETEVAVTSLGGTITLYKVNGEDIFYPWWLEENKSRGGCPVCAPWFGASPRGKKNHGFLRDMAAAGVHGKDDYGVQYEFTGADYRHDLYPWILKYYTLAAVNNDGTLKVDLKIERTADAVAGLAPVLPGFHPYFSCINPGDVKVIVKKEKFSGFFDEAQMFLLKEPVIFIEMPDKKIKMELGGAFLDAKPCMVLWTDSKDYVCVEPILEDYKLFDSPDGHYLKEGQSINLSVSYTLC